MPSQILAGSIGRYEPPTMVGKNLTDDFVFTVTHDTCMEAEKLPVMFKDAIAGTYILMKNAKFIDLQTSDFQGK